VNGSDASEYFVDFAVDVLDGTPRLKSRSAGAPGP